MPAIVIDHSQKDVGKLVISVYNEFMKKASPVLQQEKITITVCDDYIKQVYPQTIYDKRKYQWLDVLNSDTVGILKLKPVDAGLVQYDIYLRKELFDSSNYISTLVNELCHAKDYILHYHQSPNNILKNEYSEAFSFWAEFNAERTSTDWRRRELEKRGMALPLEKIADAILESLRLHSFISSKVYCLAHYYAILSLLDKDGELHFDNYKFRAEAVEYEFKDYWKPLYYLIYGANVYENFHLLRKNLKNLLDKISTIPPDSSYISKKMLHKYSGDSDTTQAST